MCKIDSQWEFAVWLRKLRQGLCTNPERWDGEGDGREVPKGVLERMESQAFEEDISQRANEAIIRYMPEYQDISIKDIA